MTYDTWIPWLRKVAHGIDPDMVDDLAQEGMIALWRAELAHDPDRSPLNYWLKFKAYRRMMDVWKSSRVRVNGQWRLRNEPVEYVADTAVSLDLDLSYHLEEIHDAVNTLPPRQREYVYMRFWRGVTKTEMINHFGYDPGHMWTGRIYGARVKLRALLDHLDTTGNQDT